MTLEVFILPLAFCQYNISHLFYCYPPQTAFPSPLPLLQVKPGMVTGQHNPDTENIPGSPSHLYSRTQLV